MAKRSVAFILLTALLAFAACGTEKKNEEIPAPGTVVGSEKQRLVVSAPPADLKQAVAGQTDFAFDLYRQLASEGSKNLFFSPYSVSVALSMTYAGAAGNTKKAFEDVFASNLPADRFHRSMNDLDAQLSSRGQGAKAADGQPFRLKVANQLFAQQDYTFETPFLDTLAVEYGANVRLMDFVTAAEPSRIAINEWVEDKTEDRIKDLLPAGSITRDSRAVLVNAIYFNASWKVQFEESATQNDAFHGVNGDKSVPFMRNGDLRVPNATVDGTELVELPYDGEELSMLVMMPPAGGLHALELSLTNAKLADYRQALHHSALELSMPKFEMTVSTNLNEPLKNLGLGPAFDHADFSAMSKVEDLAISGVLHKAFVKVNEKGTEAAAATAVIVGATSVPVTRPVVLNQPFVFAIIDKATAAVVFVGRVTEP
ncbi:MAG: serpin family protein [Myxococcaceae bacterium]|nr:serpin family protein [Myxococcaceae bacterium]